MLPGCESEACSAGGWVYKCAKERVPATPPPRRVRYRLYLFGAWRVHLCGISRRPWAMAEQGNTTGLAVSGVVDQALGTPCLVELTTHRRRHRCPHHIILESKQWSLDPLRTCTTRQAATKEQFFFPSQQPGTCLGVHRWRRCQVPHPPSVGQNAKLAGARVEI